VTASVSGPRAPRAVRSRAQRDDEALRPAEPVRPVFRGTRIREVPADGEIDLTLRINGSARQLRVPPRRLLSDALRHDLELTGTHVGCEHGVCGCCTVLLDGRPVRSCLMFAVSARGHEITTVEGLAPDGDGLHPIQQAFQECHGLQCGFCTPGFLMSVAGLLADNADPSREEIIEGISGNLCRCTGYQNIIAAVERAAELSASAAGRRGRST
jgi:carbon-monoxide dehydrogenase small subunit